VVSSQEKDRELYQWSTAKKRTGSSTSGVQPKEGVGALIVEYSKKKDKELYQWSTA